MLLALVAVALCSVLSPEDLKISNVEWSHSDANTSVSFQVTNSTKESKKFIILVKSQISWNFKTYGDSAIVSLKEIEVELSGGESKKLMEELQYKTGVKHKKSRVFIDYYETISSHSMDTMSCSSSASSGHVL